MKNHPLILSAIFYFSLARVLFVCACQLLPIVDENCNNTNNQLQRYIVHIQHPSGSANHLDTEEREQWHRSFLPQASLETGEPRMVYSYEHAISGFAARLTPQEVKAMESKDGFLHAQPVKTHPLRTTYSPEFLNLGRNNGMLPKADYGKGMIIGIIDGGIHPSHPSFNDKNMPNPPSRWKGGCDFSDKKLCTKKIIAARVFTAGISKPTPFDKKSNHGTHVAGIASGRFVGNANVKGLAPGTAVGMAPLAHIAVYKVCGPEGCSDDDMLAGVDQAIKDGVHIISVSISGPEHRFYEEPFYIASLAAVEKGIPVIACAGNSGPASSTMENGAPWFMTVGASTTDRWFGGIVTVAGKSFLGESRYYTGKESSIGGPLFSPPDNNCLKSSQNFRGKIILCSEDEEYSNNAIGKSVLNAGGLGVIIMNQKKDGNYLAGDIDVLPSSHVSYSDGTAIINLLSKSVAELRATIKNQGTKFEKMAPSVWSFSSRGPSRRNGGILKPDVVAPGVNILSASKQGFEFKSGTSMATPHVSGIAALIKKLHPNLTPAAIKSAIMTSATRFNRGGDPIKNHLNQDAPLFELGAGHIRPGQAHLSPFVYDMDADDYIPYLCGLGYTDAQVTIIARRSIRCAQVGSIRAEELNYPSISLELRDSKTIKRTVTHLSRGRQTYRAKIQMPGEIRVTVNPQTLSFSSVGEKKSFQVTFQVSKKLRSQYLEGELVWESQDKTRTVRSPILIKIV